MLAKDKNSKKQISVILKLMCFKKRIFCFLRFSKVKKIRKKTAKKIYLKFKKVFLKSEFKFSYRCSPIMFG